MSAASAWKAPGIRPSGDSSKGLYFIGIPWPRMNHFPRHGAQTVSPMEYRSEAIACGKNIAMVADLQRSRSPQLRLPDHESEYPDHARKGRQAEPEPDAK